MIDNNIKFVRENMEMTQKELGYIFGVHDTTVSGWETGKDIIPLNKLIKLSNISNYSIDYILKISRSNNEYSKLGEIDKEAIGIKLKETRTKLRLTQTQIAKECMISQTTYSNYEKGYYLISTLSLYTICKNHNLSMDDIVRTKKK